MQPATAHAARLCLLACTASGCGEESVDARAVWVDAVADGQARRIHVYDRGDHQTLTVLGENEPRPSLMMDSRGRGLLLRAAANSGVWFDLDDGRRLPLRVPSVAVEDTSSLAFSGRGDALLWLEGQDGLNVVPLAPNLALERDDGGTFRPLTEPDAVDWVVSASDAPILLTKHPDDTARFIRYPDDEHDALALVREAAVSVAELPDQPDEQHSCGSGLGCHALVAVDPDGERAIVVKSADSNTWVEFDRRAPERTGPLELPDPLASASELRLLQVLDRFVSVWMGPGFVYRWDARTGQVDAEPLFAAPPIYWFSVDRGRAVVLVSTFGVMYRIDREQLGVVNLETTTCPAIGVPVVAPSGRWAAWSCGDDSFDSPASSGAIVRVSTAGIERHVGIAMVALAIDDEGDLLVYSVNSTMTDMVDGVAPTNRPRSLFALGHSGVLSRVDEFEPAPAPIMQSEVATYLLAAALD